MAGETEVFHHSNVMSFLGQALCILQNEEETIVKISTSIWSLHVKRKGISQIQTSKRQNDDQKRKTDAATTHEHFGCR